MINHIYKNEDGKQVEVNPRLFSDEKELQQLIAENPNLLRRNMDSPDLNIYLIKREFPVRDAEERFLSLDHLMIDSKGTPVIVECKQSSNKEIPRTVVGQVIEYASTLRSLSTTDFKRALSSSGASFISDMTSEEQDMFWQNVSDNLAGERFKLVFVSDSICDRLRGIILFLDRKFPDIEVYGIEVKPYSSENLNLIMSNTVEGIKTFSAPIDNTRRQMPWSVKDLISRIEQKYGEGSSAVLSDIQTFWASLPDTKDAGGLGTKYPIIKFLRNKVSIFELWENTHNFKFYIPLGSYLDEETITDCFSELAVKNLTSKTRTYLIVDYLRLTKSKEDYELFVSGISGLISLLS